MTPVGNAELVVVGDLHGQADKLAKVLETYVGRAGKLIFVGDYVNRGPDSRGVLDLLSQARREMGDDLILLRGNHDQVLMDFLATGKPCRLMAHGGIHTISSYHSAIENNILDRFIEKFPPSHRALLEETLPYYEVPGILVSHAGFAPARPRSRNPNDMFLTSHKDLFQHTGPWPAPLTVCGHYVQTDGRPAALERLWCLDTGCGTFPDAPLTVLELEELRTIQF
ncbi:MAG: serine/threonine protein phosphatase 1 [Actinomycetota bacterium]|nr:serine/threonine protein phosphatase 1 [Actinomycetota bacterium]